MTKLEFHTAVLMSTRAGVHKKLFGHCDHQHPSYVSASRCAKRQGKKRKPGYWWRVVQIRLRPVKAAKTEIAVVFDDEDLGVAPKSKAKKTKTKKAKKGKRG